MPLSRRNDSSDSDDNDDFESPVAVKSRSKRQSREMSAPVPVRRRSLRSQELLVDANPGASQGITTSTLQAQVAPVITKADPETDVLSKSASPRPQSMAAMLADIKSFKKDALKPSDDAPLTTPVKTATATPKQVPPMAPAPKRGSLMSELKNVTLRKTTPNREVRVAVHTVACFQQT